MSMFLQHHQGEMYALGTAIFWTITALAFESASLKVGSLVVNIIRLVIGFLFLSIFTLLSRGHLLPYGANSSNWLWLGLSGFIGFFLGDLFLFKSYTIIGSRFAMLIMSLVPPITALLGRIILGEKLTMQSNLGMILTITGIALAIFNRGTGRKKISLKLAPLGLLYAFGGTVGQASGLVLSKFGMKDYDPFFATQIRIIAGVTGFTILITLLKRWNKVLRSITDLRAMKGITIGSIFGPFLGVSFSLLAIKYTKAGIASTIMAIVPVLIILPAIFLYRQKVTLLEAFGAIISVTGVALFFIQF